MAKGDASGGGDANTFGILVESLLDGRISAEGEAELARQIQADASLVDLLAETLLSDQALWNAYLLNSASDDPDWVAAVEDAMLMSSLVDEAIDSRRAHEIEEKASRLLKAQQDEERSRLRRKRPAGFEPNFKISIVIPKSIVAAGVAAVLLIAIWIGWNQSSPRSQQLASPPPAVAPSSEHDAPTPASPLHAATLTRTSGMVWDQSVGQAAHAPQPGSRLRSGEYVLESGVVEMVFEQGAAVIVQAPATFELTGTNSLSLSSGKLVANVPPSAYGFTVRAPGMNVVDLGTEFALSVRRGHGDSVADASTQVQVFTGRVMVGPSKPGGGGFQEEVVQAGEARQTQADGRGLLAGLAEPHAFYRSVPSSYERMVRELDPVVYWRFEDDDGQTSTERFGYGSGQVETVGMVKATDDAPVGSGAAFTGDGFVALRSPTGLGLTRDYTVALWVRIDQGEMRRQRFVGSPRFVQGVATSGFGLGVIPDVNTQSYRPLFTHYGVADFTTGLALTVDRWHHLAVTIDSLGEPTFYLDGRPAGARQLPNASGRARTGPGRANNADLIIGMPSDPERIDEDALRAIPFRGGLDELAIYSTVLSADQIAELARTGPHDVGGD